MTHRVSMLHGWSINYFRDTLREKDVWVARRWGVGMNTNTYEGIVSMIRTSAWLEREAKLERERR